MQGRRQKRAWCVCGAERWACWFGEFRGHGWLPNVGLRDLAKAFVFQARSSKKPLKCYV